MEEQRAERWSPGAGRGGKKLSFKRTELQLQDEERYLVGRLRHIMNVSDITDDTCLND